MVDRRYKVPLAIAALSCAIFSYNHYFTSKSASSSNNSESSVGVRLFTKEELALYDGVHNSDREIYLSILGKVYNVTRSRKNYGPGETYNVFAGRDATKAFLDRELNPETDLENFEGYSESEVKSLEDWQAFYDKEYDFMGYLIGIYYNGSGHPTSYLLKFRKIVENVKKISKENQRKNVLYPPCNVEFDPNQGTRVWCTTRSGGIERSWTGFPRQLYDESTKAVRCACINENQLNHKNIKEYEGCTLKSTSCFVRKSDEQHKTA